MDTIICLWLYHLHSEVIVKLKPDIKTVQHGLRATPVSNKAGSLSLTHLVSLVGWEEKHCDILNACTFPVLTVGHVVALWGRSGEGPQDKA